MLYYVQTHRGANVYGILRSEQTPAAEAIIITAPFRSSHQEGTAAGIALMLAFAKFAKSEYILVHFYLYTYILNLQS